VDTAALQILCITGWCRNGSTIIGNILNEIPGFFHVGELHFLWKNAAGKGSNPWCGCGRTLTTCPVWSEILPLGRPAGVSAQEHADAVIRQQLACVRTRHTWRVLKHGLHCREIREHAALMTQVYHSVASLTGARVIVDTTKIPGEAALLPHLEGVTPYYVHLVRDPRATAHSWARPKQYIHTMPAWKSTAYWVGFDLASEAITRRYPERSLFLRYEDFISDPGATVEALLRLCGSDPAANPMQDRTFELRGNHSVTGNPDRFRTGPTVIDEHDDAWRSGLPARARLAATALSWPLRWRYGYGGGPVAGLPPARVGATQSKRRGRIGFRAR
jgi:hypothetical protein